MVVNNRLLTVFLLVLPPCILVICFFLWPTSWLLVIVFKTVIWES
jgi:hypothetical protein